MKYRIGMTGLPDDEFWNSASTRGQYEKALLMGKLHDKLVAEGKFEKGDGTAFENFQKSLLEEAKSSVIVHKEVLDK
jgi:hypothetical protein